MKKTILIFVLAGVFLLQHCGDTTQLEEQVQIYEQELEVRDSTIDSLEQQLSMEEPGFIHTVFFWFAEGVTEEQKAAFVEGLESLREVPTVRKFYIGLPAGTPREVVDNSYDYALILFFDDKAGQDAYQVHPIHQAFAQGLEEVWERVQVYDTVVD
jgi:hypothetical protein